MKVGVFGSYARGDFTGSSDIDFYSIACNELLYLQENLGTVYYNSVVTGVQQIREKLLKSVVERVIVAEEQLMHSHNLRGLYSVIHSEVPREECEAALVTMYDTWEQTNRVRLTGRLVVIIQNIKICIILLIMDMWKVLWLLMVKSRMSIFLA